MARPRKPTAALILNGAFKKDPGRSRVDPETRNPIGAPPAHLTPLQKKIWKEIVKTAPGDCIRDADAPALEMLCRLVAMMRTDFEGMKGQQLNRMDALLGKFGMTPADRSKVGGLKATKPKGNPFADL